MSNPERSHIMDRLTKPDFTICTTCRAHDRCEIERRANNTPKCREAQIYERLAAYEDTGLTPEMIQQMKLVLAGETIARLTEINDVSVSRIAALANADKDSRVVILPCHVGDIVYDIEDGTPYATRVVSFVMFKDGSVSCKTVSSFPDVASFGTRIFLTLADAEEALAKEKK
jgi:hypothetical protein